MANNFKPLSETRTYQILNGMKMTGSATDSYFYIEENLYIDEAETIYNFCKWIDNEIGGCGPINIQDLWYAFNHPQEQFSKNVAKHWKEKMEKINSYC